MYGSSDEDDPYHPLMEDGYPDLSMKVRLPEREEE